MGSRVEQKRAWLWALSLLAALAVGAGSAWSFSASTSRDNTSRLDAADLALGSVAVTRATLNQAVLVATSHATGDASDAALAAALDELATNTSALRELSLSLHVQPGFPEMAGFAEAVLAALASGDVDAARAAAEASSDAYSADVAALTSSRAAALAEIDGAARWATNVDLWTRIGAIVGLPLMAALLVFAGTRKRFREQRSAYLAAISDVEDQAAAADALVVEASHRLRTPLTSVYGLSEVLAHSKKVSGLERELANLVHGEAVELHRVADDVLALAQHRTNTLQAMPEIVSLPSIIDDAVKPAQALGVEVKVECPEVWVLSDPAKVQQIVRNLVANAAVHGREPIFVEASEIDGRVECVVVDHGEGLPVDTADRPDAGASPGRGLEVAHLLAASIDAQLTYDRTDDQTRFTLAFADEVANSEAS